MELVQLSQGKDHGGIKITSSNSTASLILNDRVFLSLMSTLLVNIFIAILCLMVL